MLKAIDNYAQGRQREVVAWSGTSIPASSGRFICPECLENVALDIRGHFRHKNRTPQSVECDKRVDSPSRSAYDRMGLPIYLCKQSEGQFTLGIGFSGQDQSLLIQAENACSYLTISDLFHQEHKYIISTNRFLDNGVSIIPVNYRPANNGQYRIHYSENTPRKLRTIWTDHTDVWGDGQFYKTGDINSRKIRPLGTVVTDESYYFTGSIWRIRRFSSFVSIREVGKLGFDREQVEVYEIKIIRSQASSYDFKSFSELLRITYKVNLLVGESSLDPIWPPCCEMDNRIIFPNTTQNGLFAVKTPNEYPTIYRYWGGMYDSSEIKDDIPPAYSLHLTNDEIPICVDRAFNGNIQFISRRLLEEKYETLHADIVNGTGESILGRDLVRINKQVFVCKTNFNAVVHIYNCRKKDICKTISDTDGTPLADCSWGDTVDFYTQSGALILRFTFRKSTHTDDACSKDEEYAMLLRQCKGALQPITPKILALYKRFSGYPIVKKEMHKYIVKGVIPSDAASLLIQACGRE